ncbi:glycosyltransferase [Mucilaginibacter terrenus]|uniref:Glycosyltransferase n=1 Tax=Mucilaginibacter terrenus TaxID=2482727 RepID=A0A3E2NV26_9SPHI|nr:glycosyltransferase [Mucilaginibacter terrenus]RFZ84807.1 glycosyltransferase [Mucilaginibacter terrenus]
MIAGCTVIYNPEWEVIGNLKSYAATLSVLYVVDNSDIKNHNVLSAIKAIPQVIYIDNGGNKGIANALNVACNLALKAGYHWILTMDQDTSFMNTAFFHTVENLNDDTIAICSASYTGSYDRWTKNFDKNFDEIHFVVTSGNLLNLNVWVALKGFEEKLFIDEVDHDFCAKARVAGFKILTSKQIYLQHNLGVPLTTHGSNVVTGHSPLRYYYITRNTLYITFKYFFSDFALVSNRIKHLFKSVVRIILYYPDKKNYAKFIIKGVYDFLTGHYGKLEINYTK